MERNQPKPNDFFLSRSGHDHGLPQQILEEIIVRLPAKSTVRFKSVCREWCNIISDLDLPEVNFQQSASKLMMVCLSKNGRSDGFRFFSLELYDKGMKAREVCNFCTLSLHEDDSTKVSCASLLHCRGKPCWRNSKLYMYDAIAQQLQLTETGGFVLDYTMVYDASKGEQYRVIVFVYHNYIRGMKLLSYDLNPRRWWRSKGKWRKSRPPLAQIIQRKSSIFIQGVLYWIAKPPIGQHNVTIHGYFIQPMEIATEKFMDLVEIPCTPAQWPRSYMGEMKLLEVKGSLGLTNVNADTGEVYAWVLKDSMKSFWIKQYTISLSSILCSPSFLRRHPFPDYFDFHPRLIVEHYILLTFRGVLYWYNIDTNEMSDKITANEYEPYATDIPIIKC